MITLTAKINLLSGNNKALSLGSTNLLGNNISSDLSGVVGVKKNGRNPFIIGASKIGDGSTFSNGVDYFIGNELSDNNGNFIDKSGIEFFYVINISSKTPLNNIGFSFDTINKKHPKKIKIYKIEENEIYDVSEEFNGIKFKNDYGGDYYNYSIDLSEIEKKYNTTISNASISSLSYIISETSLKDVVVVDGYYDFDTKTFSGVFSTEGIEFNGNEFNINGSLWAIVDISFEEPIIETIEYELGEYTDNDSTWTISNLSGAGIIDSNNYKIELFGWSAPKSPFVLTGIYSEISIDIDQRNLIDISRTIYDRSDLNLPSYGVVSNIGNIKFNDLDGEIRDYAEQLLLEKGLKCEIKLNNTLVKNASQTIAIMQTNQWDYDNENRIVSVSIKDDLEKWQNIEQVESFIRDAELGHLQNNAYSVVMDLQHKTKEYGFVFEELDNNTKEHLINTYIEFPYIEKGSLWSQWVKVCEAFMLHVYKNEQNKVVIKHYV